MRNSGSLNVRKCSCVQEKHSEHKDVITPNMFNVDLWCTSGHADYYKANTFFIDVGKAEFGLKPSLV